MYLAVINNIDGIYGVTDQDLISSADVDSNGNFVLAGNDLPDEPRFYRLYLTKDSGTKYSIITGGSRNYILLVLDNKTGTAVRCDDFCKESFTYTTPGPAENEGIVAVQNILTGYYSVNWPTLGESKKRFLNARRYAELRQFADTTTMLLAGMWGRNGNGHRQQLF